MNKYLRAFGLVTILCFTFYYTEHIAKFMRSKDPIYETIEEFAKDYQINSVNAIINGDMIIPGLVGREVNLEKSFRNMKNNGYFNEADFVYEEIKPIISLEENKDKIIQQGNSEKHAVSFILENAIHSDYFEQMKIFYAILTTKENKNFNYLYGTKINIDKNNYEETEKYLKSKKENNNLCYVSNSEELCQQNGKLRIKETYVLNNSNFLKKYRFVESGDIIFLSKNLSLSHLQILMQQIYFKGYDILPINTLISEAR